MDVNGKAVTLGDRLVTYAIILKQLNTVISELENVGFVTMADANKWEKLIWPERARVTAAMQELGVSVHAKLPSLEAVKSAGVSLKA